METIFVKALEESLKKHDEKVALTFVRESAPDAKISFGLLDRLVNGFARQLVAAGITKGDRVILIMEKSPVFLVAHLAVMKIGAICVPLNPGFKKPELDYFLKDSGARLVIADAERSGVIHELNPEVKIVAVDAGLALEAQPFFRNAGGAAPPVDLSKDDPALIIYTSGTTGKPKGAVLTQGNLFNDARNINRVWAIVAGDTICHVLPLFHVHGLCFALHTAMLAGSRVVMLDRFEANRVIDVLSAKRGDLACTVFMAVPAMYTRLINTVREQGGRDFSHIRLWASGSAPLLESTFKAIRETLGREPVEREGMSETGMNFTNPLMGQKKPGSIGIPLPGVDVRIVDPQTGRDVAEGAVGEIWLKGKSITSGYWKKPEVTAEAFDQGWFKTGDLGRVDRQGYYYLTDRMKNIIISGGENISPREIEAVINRMEAVAVAVVVGLPDEQWGEKVAAAIVLKAPGRLTADQVKDECRRHLHDWKCPREIVFVEAIPRNVMGKVLVDKVRGLFFHRPSVAGQRH